MALEVAQTIYELAKRHEHNEAHYIEIALEDATRMSVTTLIEVQYVSDIPLRLTYKTMSFDIGCLGDFYFVTELLLPNIIYDSMQKIGVTHTTEFMSVRIQLRNANSVFAKFLQPLPDDIADITFLNVDTWDRGMSIQNKIRCLVFMCCRLLWLRNY